MRAHRLVNPTTRARFQDSYCRPCDSCAPGREAAAYSYVELRPSSWINGTYHTWLRARANSDAEARNICKHLWSGYTDGKWGGSNQSRNGNGEVVANSTNPATWYAERKSWNYLNTELHCWIRP